MFGHPQTVVTTNQPIAQTSWQHAAALIGLISSPTSSPLFVANIGVPVRSRRCRGRVWADDDLRFCAKLQALSMARLRHVAPTAAASDGGALQCSQQPTGILELMFQRKQETDGTPTCARYFSS